MGRPPRLLSSARLKTILSAFLAIVILGITGGTTHLVSGVFAQLRSSIYDDLRWKAERGPGEIARRVDVALALGEPVAIASSFGAYRDNPDVQGVVVTDPEGKPLVTSGQGLKPSGALFQGDPGVVHEDESSFWSWWPANIEGQNIGKVAVVVHKGRLHAVASARARIMTLALVMCGAALVASFFFVGVYLGPLLRFTEQTLTDLRELNTTLESRVEERTQALRAANGGLERSLVDLKSTQNELQAASRRAGMADVATTVLHNVGNVLTSVNVSSEILADKLSDAPANKLEQVAQLLKENQQNMRTYLVDDPRGKKLPDYLIALSEAHKQNRADMLSEINVLRVSIDHIKNIVSHQQQLAQTQAGTIEVMPVDSFVGDVVQMVKPSFDKHAVALVAELGSKAVVRLDRHKLLQIMINLLSNARHAVADKGEMGRVTIATHDLSDAVTIVVSDNGCGITQADLNRVFEMGFTTKKDGHGFGLHGSACHIMSMGGTLLGHSPGPGQGASFTIRIPLNLSTETPSLPEVRPTNPDRTS